MMKPLDLVKDEARYLKNLNPKWIFIRDENFPLQNDWVPEVVFDSYLKLKTQLSS
ncbi:MAG: hypothetical protein E7K14_01980 [Bacillota bacterium]|nr:hypothetical protein [Bacillota bacterium]